MTNIKKIFAVALASSVLVAVPAFSQTTVGTIEVPEADMPKVQAYCDDLALNELNGETAGTRPDEQREADEAQEDDVDSMNSSVSIDLEAITLDDCKAAGLVTE